MNVFATAFAALGSISFAVFKLWRRASASRQGGLWMAKTNTTLMADCRMLADVNLVAIDDAIYFLSFPLPLARAVAKAGD